MNKPLFTELVFTLILTVLIVLLFNPMHIWMPMAIHLVMVGVLLAVFSVVSVIIFRHIGEDEREQSLRLS
jgi:hypothetical protein